MFYECKHFRIEELVPRKVFNHFGEKAWWFVDPYQAMELDIEREYFYGTKTGADYGITINDWLWGGNYEFSGFRPIDYKEGAKYSLHRMGSAFDRKFKGSLTPAEVAQEIIKHKDNIFKWITCIEDTAYTPTWLHGDGRNTEERILIVRP